MTRTMSFSVTNDLELFVSITQFLRNWFTVLVPVDCYLLPLCTSHVNFWQLLRQALAGIALISPVSSVFCWEVSVA